MERPRQVPWFLVTWGAGMIGGVLDWSTLLLLKNGLLLPTAVAAAAGLTVGNAVNFWVNRRFAFRGAPGLLGHQALRYLLAFALVMPVHASLMTLCVDGASVPLPVAKVGCDLLVFAAAFPILLRNFVFPKTWRPMFGEVPRLARGV